MRERFEPQTLESRHYMAAHKYIIVLAKYSAWTFCQCMSIFVIKFRFKVQHKKYIYLKFYLFSSCYPKQCTILRKKKVRQSPKQQGVKGPSVRSLRQPWYLNWCHQWHINDRFYFNSTWKFWYSFSYYISCNNGRNRTITSYLLLTVLAFCH